MNTERRIALVGCVKTKRSGVHPARDLYVSPLFLRRRAFVEAARLPWFILSAKHGLVAPEAELRKYEMTLNTMSAADRRAWGARVLGQLREQLGDLDGLTFEFHAGARYVEALEQGLGEAGARIDVPTEGLTMGRQLAWYTEHTRKAER